MSRDWLIAQFADGGPGDNGTGQTTRADQGDHVLNPGLQTSTPIKPAAVLMPVVDRDDELSVILTLRTDNLASHPGQVSFPGGHIEPEDEDPEDAALRETEEEVGLARSHVRVLGRLAPYLTRTGYEVIPVIGLVSPPFDIEPDPGEVAEVFEVPLGFLLDPANHQRHSRIYQGSRRYYYAMPYGDHYIWGATAGMIVNLYEFLGELEA
jgi:8-oxo-dGTP pyrophosphatase MutT (NUDIX family)